MAFLLRQENKTGLSVQFFYEPVSDRYLGDEASLFETEITGPTDGRCAAHNHVIQHLHLQESGAIGKSAS